MLYNSSPQRAGLFKPGAWYKTNLWTNNSDASKLKLLFKEFMQRLLFWTLNRRYHPVFHSYKAILFVRS